MKLKKIKPLFDRLIVTSDKYIESNSTTGATGLIDISKIQKGIKEYQRVIEVGTGCRFVKEGDIVCINPSRYAIRKHSKDSMKSSMDEIYNPVTSYAFNVVNIDNKEYLMLTESDIDFICTEYEQ